MNSALSEVVPDWLADVVRPKKAPVPWPDMIRAVFAIWVPLAAGFITGRSSLVAVPALGALLSVMIDSGGLGPIGELRPWWHTALQFVAGAVWALILIMPSWLLAPRAAEQRAVGAVYHALAKYQRAIGTPAVRGLRGAVTAALNAAYDALLTGRSNATGGRNQADMALMAILNVSHQMTEATTALHAAGERPPPWITDTIDRLAGVIERRGGRGRRGGRDGAGGAALPFIPPPWSESPGALALRDSLVSLSRAISGDWAPPSAPAAPADPRSRLRDWAARLGDQLLGGQVAAMFSIRLMVCTGVAAVITQVVSLQRSYWVLLTVAIILKPDYGSVFARAVQRGLGTVVGAVLGAAILAVVP